MGRSLWPGCGQRDLAAIEGISLDHLAFYTDEGFHPGVQLLTVFHFLPDIPVLSSGVSKSPGDGQVRSHLAKQQLNDFFHDVILEENL